MPAFYMKIFFVLVQLDAS